MKRSVAAVALIGMLSFAGAALAGPGPRSSARAAAPVETVAEDAFPATPSQVWSEPSGSFSINKPVAWRDVDTASEIGAPVLEIVVSGDSGECWFARAPRPSTAALAPNDLIKVRAKPMSYETWGRIGAQQHLIGPAAQVVEAAVEAVGIWPVQTAWFHGPAGDVFAALHSRPGLDIWAFCSAKKSRKAAVLLRGVALSVLTPKDSEWIRLVSSQPSLTAVP